MDYDLFFANWDDFQLDSLLEWEHEGRITLDFIKKSFLNNINLATNWDGMLKYIDFTKKLEERKKNYELNKAREEKLKKLENLRKEIDEFISQLHHRNRDLIELKHYLLNYYDSFGLKAIDEEINANDNIIKTAEKSILEINKQKLSNNIDPKAMPDFEIKPEMVKFNNAKWDLKNEMLNYYNFLQMEHEEVEKKLTSKNIKNKSWLLTERACIQGDMNIAKEFINEEDVNDLPLIRASSFAALKYKHKQENIPMTEVDLLFMEKIYFLLKENSTGEPEEAKTIKFLEKEKMSGVKLMKPYFYLPQYCDYLPLDNQADLVNHAVAIERMPDSIVSNCNEFIIHLKSIGTLLPQLDKSDKTIYLSNLCKSGATMIQDFIDNPTKVKITQIRAKCNEFIKNHTRIAYSNEETKANLMLQKEKLVYLVLGEYYKLITLLYSTEDNKLNYTDKWPSVLIDSVNKHVQEVEFKTNEILEKVRRFL